MMSSSSMSAAIRAKKKKMMEEHSDAVKLSGIPEDATDIAVLKMHEATDPMNENHPKDRDEDPSLESLIESDSTNGSAPYESAPDPMELDEKKKKQAKIKAIFMKMGR